MKRTTANLAALALALTASACFSKSEPKRDLGVPQAPGQAAPEVHHEAHGGPAWKLNFNSNCASQEKDNCLGGYGFSVDAEGQYAVGPGPDGQVLRGKLPAAEFKAVEGPVAKLLGNQGVSIASETCAARTESDESDSVVLERRSERKELIRTTTTDFCASVSVTAEAQGLHAAIKNLAAKYYPTPFPDECINAALKVEDLYASVTSCNHDSDCAYIDNTYAPIPTGDLQFVITDDCSFVKPLVVANRDAAIHASDRLFAARDWARGVCAARAPRVSCTGITGFQATQGNPVCVQGSCRISPAVTF